MRRIDELHLDYPFAGSRMLRDLLRGEGVAIRREQVTMRQTIPSLLRVVLLSPGDFIRGSPDSNSTVKGNAKCRTATSFTGCDRRSGRLRRAETCGAVQHPLGTSRYSQTRPLVGVCPTSGPTRISASIVASLSSLCRFTPVVIPVGGIRHRKTAGYSLTIWRAGLHPSSTATSGLHRRLGPGTLRFRLILVGVEFQRSGSRHCFAYSPGWVGSKHRCERNWQSGLFLRIGDICGGSV